MVEIKHGTFGSAGKQQEVKQDKMSVPDLRSLVELGCIRETIEINGMVFEMRSLSAAERIETSKIVGTELEPDKVFDLNVLTLALSVDKVNGVPLEELYDGEPTNNALTARKYIIKQLQHSVLSKLTSCYVELTQRADAQFNAEQVKN